MHSCGNDGVIQLGPLGSDAIFEVVEISDASSVTGTTQVSDVLKGL